MFLHFPRKINIDIVHTKEKKIRNNNRLGLNNGERIKGEAQNKSGLTQCEAKDRMHLKNNTYFDIN